MNIQPTGTEPERVEPANVMLASTSAVIWEILLGYYRLYNHQIISLRKRRILRLIFYSRSKQSENNWKQYNYKYSCFYFGSHTSITGIRLCMKKKHYPKEKHDLTRCIFIRYETKWLTELRYIPPFYRDRRMIHT